MALRLQANLNHIPINHNKAYIGVTTTIDSVVPAAKPAIKIPKMLNGRIYAS